MNVSASECSSGCESGWTLYLDQTSVSVNECHRVIEEEDEEEEEDLSMVSDASSGPPHYNEDDECENGYRFYSNFSGSELGKEGKRKKKMKEHGRNQLQHPCLDDTASSPVLSFSKKNLGLSNNQDSMQGVMDFSQGFSATHYKEKSALKKHFGFLKSSFAEKPDSKQPGGFQGRKWE